MLEFFYIFIAQNLTATLLPLSSPYEEKLLLERISAGDEKAFRVFYDLYFDRLTAYIFKLCKSPLLTEEVVQDIFTKLWESRGALSRVEAPEAYVISMARNRTLDYLRRIARETSLMSVLRRQLDTAGNSTLDQLDADDLRRLVEDALKELSPQKKTIFRLRNTDGLSADEIAEIMQLSRSTVKNHLSQTLRHIRGRLGRHPRPESLLLILLLLTR
jgi:RNA polymerase sigma-70 factor (family 1)